MEDRKEFKLIRLTKDNVLSFGHYFDRDLMNAMTRKDFDGVGLLHGKTAAGGFIAQESDTDTRAVEIHAFRVHSEYAGDGGEELLLRAAEAMTRDKGRSTLVYRYMDEKDAAVEFFKRSDFLEYGVTGEVIHISREDLGAVLKKKSSEGELAKKAEEELDSSLKGGKAYKEAVTLKKDEDGGWSFALDLKAAHGRKKALGLIRYAFKDAYEKMGDGEELCICVPEEESVVYDKLFEDIEDIKREAVYIMEKDVRPSSVYDYASDSFIYFVPRLNTLTEILSDMGLEGDMRPSDDDEALFELRVPEGEPARYLSYLLSFREEEGHRVPSYATKISTYIYFEDEAQAKEMMEKAEESDILYCAEDYPEEGVVSVNAVMTEGLEMPGFEDYRNFLNGYESELEKVFGIKALALAETGEEIDG